MKKLVALVLSLMLLFSAALAESSVVNLIDNPDAEYAFQEGRDLFTVVYANTHGADAAVLLYQDEVWMIDCATDDQSPHLVIPTLQELGVTHVDVAFNSHPHDDHITGFEFLDSQATIGELMLAFPEGYNHIQKRTVYRLRNKGAAITYVNDGDVLTMGDGGVEMTVIRRTGGGFTTNDLSAVLHIRYGERSLFSTGDIENRGQQGLLDNPPACGVKADILKYPHHGHAVMNRELFAQIAPELAIITAHEMPADDGFAFMKSVDTPALSTWYGIIRLRTDGVIWVVDHLPTRVMNK